MSKRILALSYAFILALLITSLAFGGELRKLWVGDLDLQQTDGGAAETATSPGEATGTRMHGGALPWDNSYSRTIRPGGITGNSSSPGRIQNYNFGSASYTDNGYFADLITKRPWVDARAGYGTIVYGSGASSAQQTANAATMQAAIDYAGSVGRRVVLPDNVYFNTSLTIISSTSKPFTVDFRDATIYYTATDNTNAFIFPADSTERKLTGGRLYGPALNVSCSYTGPSQVTYGTGSAIVFTGNSTSDVDIDINLISGFGGLGINADISGFTFNRIRTKKISKVNTGLWLSGNSNDVDIGYVSEVHTGVKLGNTGRGILTLDLGGRAIEAASYGISLLGDQILDELDIHVRYMETIDNTAIISTASTVKAPVFRNMRISVPAGKMLLDVSSGNMKWATFIGNSWGVAGGGTGMTGATLNQPTYINNEMAYVGNSPTIINDETTTALKSAGWEVYRPSSYTGPFTSLAAPYSYSIPYNFTYGGNINIRDAWLFRTKDGGNPATDWQGLYAPIAATPASSTAECKQNMMAWNATYFYGCIADNTWKRVAWDNTY
mgnify:CR=1 FL=1